jgi:hypothetical protein
MQSNINVGRPNMAPQAPRQFNPNDGVNQPAPTRGSRLPWVLLLVVIVIVAAVLGVLFRDKLGMGKAEGISEYQAVFLTNGQVYFGKLSDKNDKYVTLNDIYYLQVNQALQQTQNGQQPAANQQPQLSLVKLGNELHGPVDEMKINRDQILFFEDIKKDGRVAQAIAEYQANPTAGQQPQQQAPATQAPATQQPNTTTPNNNTNQQNNNNN